MLLRRKITSLVLCALMAFGSPLAAFADGSFAYGAGEKLLYSSSFDDEAGFDKNNNCALTDEGMKVTGKRNLIRMSDESFTDGGVSVKIKTEAISDGGYGAVAFRCGENGGYELRFYPQKSFKTGKAALYCVSGDTERLIAEKNAVCTGKEITLKAGFKGEHIRALVDGAVIFSVYDKTFETGKTGVAAGNSAVVFSDFKVETETSFYFENYKNGELYTGIGDSLKPTLVEAQQAAKWENAGGALTTKGSGTLSRMIYDKLEIGGSSAVTANVKSSDWGIDGDTGGFSIYMRYEAGNRCYKFFCHDNTAEIIKVNYPYSETVLGAPVRLGAKNGAFTELAAELIENDGKLTINMYSGGNLILSAEDGSDIIKSGGFGIEAKGGFVPIISELNVIEIDPKRPLYKIYADGRKGKPIEVSYNGDAVQPLKNPIIIDNAVFVPAEQFLKLIGAEVKLEGDTLTARKGIFTMTAEIGMENMTLNGESFRAYAAPMNIDGVFMADANSILGCFGAVTGYVKDKAKLEITYSDIIPQDGKIFEKDGTVFALSADGKSFRYLKLSGVDGGMKGSEKTPVWKLYFIDKNVEKANETNQPEGAYMQAWVTGDCTADSTEAQLTDVQWNRDGGMLELSYKHDWADVSVTAKITGENIDFSCSVTNKCDYPIQKVKIPVNWNTFYSAANTVIVPTSSSAVEYTSILGNYHSTFTAAWDGLFLTGRKVFGIFNIQHEYDENGAPIMCCETQESGSLTKKNFDLLIGEIVYRKKGESVETVPVRIGVFDNIRDYCDKYINVCYPNMKTIYEKIPEADRDIYAKSYFAYLDFGRYNDFKKISEELPGHAIMHNTTSMHSNGDYGGFDAFPNYFPPNEEWGTMEDLSDYGQVLRKNGHIFMPRNSFYYITKDSDLDRSIGCENLAIVRMDGKAQRADWARPGWIMSPFSKTGNEFLDSTYNTWKSAGATAYFTNVITVLNPECGYLYDFSSESPRPDYFFNGLIARIKKEGDRLPLFTEGAAGIRMPYQVGMMTDSEHQPGEEVRSYMLSEWRGAPVRVRKDVQCMMTSKYIKNYIPNHGKESHGSIRAVSYALMYNVGLKLHIVPGEEGKSDARWRWLRATALISDIIGGRLYGKEMENEVEYLDNDVRKGEYEGNKITANLGEEPFASGNSVITPNGFEFRSADKLVSGGVYDVYNGHEFNVPQMILTEEDGASTKVYAPIADSEFEICVPNKGFDKPQVTAYYQDGTTAKLECVKGENGIIFKYPYFDPSLGAKTIDTLYNKKFTIKTKKLIPYVRITEGGTPSENSAVIVNAQTDIEEYGDFEKLPGEIGGSITVENFSGKTVSGKIKLSGTFFGKPVNAEYEINTDELRYKIPLSFKLDQSSTDTGAELSLSASGFTPCEIKDKLVINNPALPQLNSLESVKSKYTNVYLDWDMKSTDALGAKLNNAVNVKNPYGSGMRFDNGSYIEFSDSAIKFDKKLYVEMIVKFKNRMKNMNIDTQNLVNFTKPVSSSPSGASIQLKYMASLDSFTGTLPGMTKYNEAMNRRIDPHEDEWYHVAFEYDKDADGRNKVTVNGQEEWNFLGEEISGFNGPVKIGGNFCGEIAYLRIAGK